MAHPAQACTKQSAKATKTSTACCQCLWVELLCCGALPCEIWHLQVLETRAELDSLEEIANCPMVIMRIAKYSPFLAAAPEMLQSTRSVAEFEARLVELLFPEVPLLQYLVQQ